MWRWEIIKGRHTKDVALRVEEACANMRHQLDVRTRELDEALSSKLRAPRSYVPFPARLVSCSLFST